MTPCGYCVYSSAFFFSGPSAAILAFQSVEPVPIPESMSNFHPVINASGLNCVKGLGLVGFPLFPSSSSHPLRKKNVHFL